jgi:protein-S-isoprenylcysteine O-methyltransferase Ste14
MKKDQSMLKDHIQRGDYTHQKTPKLIFSVFRIADPLIGVSLLITWVDKFSRLSDVFAHWQVVVFFSCVSIAVLNQIYWVWFLSRERFTWFMALFPWNNALDWTWVYFLSKALNSNVLLAPWIWIGATLFIMGTLVEIISNVQLQRFNSDATNQGKLYRGGMFSVVIHPNYLGYILWRSSLPLMTGFPVLAGISILLHSAQFYFHAHPPFHRYMSAKYGQAWEDYIATRKKIFPVVL